MTTADTAGNYGGGASTGIEQTASGSITTGFRLNDMHISQEDAQILRRLAEQVAAIAASARMKEIEKAWTALNELRPVRPVFFCDPENGWNEIITEKQMQCKGLLARRWEMNLRKKIFANDCLQDDTPVSAFFDVPYTASPDDWGLPVVFEKTQSGGSAHWLSPVKDYAADLEKISLRPPQIDRETTGACLEETKRVLGGILNVRLKGTWWWSLGVTMPFVFLRGLQNMMLDFYDCPDEAKELLRRISAGHLSKLDWLEQNGLLALNNDATYVGSGGYGFTGQLPARDFSGRVRCWDMWGFTESQESVGCSPEMYKEFIFPYEEPVMQRFGLTCYGCCEGLHSRWETVKKHHSLRRVSCSPWADYPKMAQYLQSDYIFSLKANPAELAVEHPNFDKIRSDLRRNLDITKGCVLEIIMKDNNTLAGKPDNLIRWSRIVREETTRRS